MAILLIFILVDKQFENYLFTLKCKTRFVVYVNINISQENGYN